MKILSLIFIAALGITITFNGHADDTATAAPPQAEDATSAASMNTLNRLVKGQQYAQAYSLAKQLLDDSEGLPEFDFQYGMAAIESGHYDQALFAFERLVLGFPKQSRYRLELARTHFYLRNLVRAEVEFNNVMKRNPPSAVKKNVILFLNRITELKRSVESKFLFVLDSGVGYDSNINSATREKALPKEELVFPVDITLNDASRETGSAYWNLLAHMAYVKPITKTSAIDVRLVASNRNNTETNVYDLSTAMAELGYSFYIGPVKWRGAGRYQHVQLDGEALLNTQSAIGQGNWLLDKGANIGFGINYGLSHYPENSSGDMTQQQFNLSYASPAKKQNWKLTLVFGIDKADDSSNKHSGKQSQGFTYQNTTLTSQRANRYWMFSVLSSEYDGINSALYSKLRKDQNAMLGFGWRYNFNSHFSFRNDFSYTYNDSTLEANTFQRGKVEFGVTYNF